MLLLTEPEEEKEKEDVEEDPATKDLNARLASRWHPFDIVLIHRESRENESFFESEYIFLCLFVVSSAKERREGKKSEAFDLGYTTLILNASQQKKNKISSVKRGRVSLFSSVPH